MNDKDIVEKEDVKFLINLDSEKDGITRVELSTGEKIGDEEVKYTDIAFDYSVGDAIKKGMTILNNYLYCVKVAEDVLPILNATMSDDEIGVFMEYNQYYFDLISVKRNIFYYCERISIPIIPMEHWELVRFVTQMFISDWLENSTHLPYNKVLHENWNYEKYGDDWRSKLEQVSEDKEDDNQYTQLVEKLTLENANLESSIRFLNKRIKELEETECEE